MATLAVLPFFVDLEASISRSPSQRWLLAESERPCRLFQRLLRDIVFIIIPFCDKHGANIQNIFQCWKEKGQKLAFLWFSGLRQYAFGDYSTWEQGKRYGQAGSETACNRERDGVSLNSNARPYKLGRAPLYVGAPALICWSGRSKPSFIL